MMRLSPATCMIAAIAGIFHCTAASSEEVKPTRLHSTKTTMTGWIVFTNEIRLYRREEDIGKLYDKTCISGQFDTFAKQKRAERRFERKHVRITGFLLNARAYWDANPFGATIENYCDADDILIVQTIAAEPEPTR